MRVRSRAFFQAASAFRPSGAFQVRVEYPGVELDAAPGAEAPAGLVEGIERAPGDVVLMVAQADPLQGDAELFHPHGGILVQLVPPLKRELGGVLNRVGRDLHAEGKARRLAEEPSETADRLPEETAEGVHPLNISHCASKAISLFRRPSQDSGDLVVNYVMSGSCEKALAIRCEKQARRTAQAERRCAGVGSLT